MTSIYHKPERNRIDTILKAPFRFLRKWWLRVENSALSPELSIKENARIKLLNRLYLGILPLNLLVGFLNLFVYKDYFATGLVGLVLGFFILSFLQARAGRFTLSRWLAIVPIIVILDVLTCTYGRTAGGSISFLLIGVSSVVLFEKGLDRYFALGLLAVSFIFTEWYVSAYQVVGGEVDFLGVLPPLIFTINFFIMLMVLLYFEEFLQRSRKENDLLLEDIKQQNEALTQTNYELAHFANTASHHFQSPLRNISAMLSVMDRSIPADLPNSVKTYMDLIKGDAKQLYSFVDDILTYARIGQGESWSCAGTATLKQVVLSATSQLKIPTDVVTVERDILIPMNPDHLHLVMVNLLDNACKYNLREPRIHIQALEKENETGPSLMILVSDNGIGIEQEYQNQIFGMFSRLHTQDQIPGSGIGLAVCNRILKKYGGTLSLSRSDATGSEFVITIPLEVKMIATHV